MKLPVTCGAFNLGDRNGHSMSDVVCTSEPASAQEVPFRETVRRAGDPPVLVADGFKAMRALAWKPQYPDLETIVKTAWQWHESRCAQAVIPTQAGTGTEP